MNAKPSPLSRRGFLKRAAPAAASVGLLATASLSASEKSHKGWTLVWRGWFEPSNCLAKVGHWFGYKPGEKDGFFPVSPAPWGRAHWVREFQVIDTSLYGDDADKRMSWPQFSLDAKAQEHEKQAALARLIALIDQG